MSPLAGRVLPINQAGDPVFADQTVGPGVAIEPEPQWVVVTAPVAGRLAALQPHSFALETPDGTGVLVHLGIDTVKLQGRGFGLIAAQGDTVAQGDAIVEWDPSTIAAPATASTVLVVALDRPADSLAELATGRQVAAGDKLFSIPAP